MIKLPEYLRWRGLTILRVHNTGGVLWKTECFGTGPRPDLGGITARVEKRRGKKKPYEALVCIDGRGYTDVGNTSEEALEGSLQLRIGRAEDWLRRVKIWEEETKL